MVRKQSNTIGPGLAKGSALGHRLSFFSKMRRSRLDPDAVYSRKTRRKSCGRVQSTWEKASVSFLSHVERAKGALGTHGDVPAGLRVGIIGL